MLTATKMPTGWAKFQSEQDGEKKMELEEKVAEIVEGASEVYKNGYGITLEQEAHL